MFNNILNSKGAQKLTKKQQLSISGGGITGNCSVTINGVTWWDMCERSANNARDKAIARGDEASVSCAPHTPS